MKIWIYPTLVFLLFLYVMMFVLIYTYGIESRGDSPSATKGSVTGVHDLKNEIMKKFK